jgi:GNAT superfamily N-acetyltransferase
MKTYETKCPGFTIREAQAGDAPLLFDLICGLAEYEKMRDAVEGNPETLHKNLFENNQANVLIGEENGVPVCFALYFYNFSTFQCKHGLYLEDLFIKPEYRGKGYGKMLVEHAIEYARTLSPCTLMLTSNPARIAANELYRASGFEQKITNVYKMSL